MDLPVIDLSPSLSGEWDPLLCAEVSRSLRETGALLVKDPRCTVEDNDRFIDMMERYFSKPRDFKHRHERPHLHYQVKFLSFDVILIPQRSSPSGVWREG